MNKQCIIFGVMIIVMMVTGQPPDPNIIFIWFDDLSIADFGYYGASYPTPIIDSFALKSIRIHNHYTEPLCGPSRNAFLTGRYSWRVGATGNGGSIDYGVSYDSENELFPQHLKRERGTIYKTFIAGKAHLGYKYAADLPENRGFDEQLLPITSPGTGYHSKQNCQQMSSFDNKFPVNDNIKTQRDTLFPDDILCYHDFRTSTDNVFIGDETYKDELYTQAVTQFIDQYANTNKLFIYLSLHTPHSDIVEPPTNRDDVDYTICDIQDLDENKRLFCRSMQYGQALINDVVNALKNNNIYDNSIIIISSDNGGSPAGFARTLPFRGKKGVFFEGGIRTPNFMMGGYIDKKLSKWTNNEKEDCDYNGLVHVSDWYHIFLNIIGLNDDNKDSDHIDMNIWKDIRRECKTSENLHTNGRKEIIGMRFCNDDINEYLTPAFIRYNEWKLVINGTSQLNRPCDVPSEFIRTGVYVTESGDTSPIPNDEIYQETQNNAEIAHFYKSECYDNIPLTERNENNILFKFDEFMLFNMETDKIEACNVANQHPDIVNTLTQKIISRRDDYNGGGSPYNPKSGGGLLSRVNTFDCENSMTFPISWDGLNDDLTDGNIIWQALIDKKNECISGSSKILIPIIFIDDDGLHIHFIKKNVYQVLYIVVIMLLIMAAACFAIYKCLKLRNSKRSKGKYGKVQQCSTEDDDEENDAFIQ